VKSTSPKILSATSAAVLVPHQLPTALTFVSDRLLTASPSLPDRSLLKTGATLPAESVMRIPSPVFPVMKFSVTEVRLPPSVTWMPVPLAVMRLLFTAAEPPASTETP